MKRKPIIKKQYVKKPQASSDADQASRDAQPDKNRKMVIYSCSPEGLVHHWQTDEEIVAAYRRSPPRTDQTVPEDETD